MARKHRKPTPRPGPNKQRTDNPNSDLIWGAKDIAALINRTPDDVYRMHYEGKLPTHKCGLLIVAIRAELLNPACWPCQRQDEIADRIKAAKP